ncbi:MULTISPECIES: segregation and condensation protein A [Pseudothermotoga]|uniref:Segregation and condensation protein A n=1 Tax=Pseudothermotoga lettingae (strain ATCC BAA-301 / DSM 14385 / NBRC 107922 / TMO) TaxID=416591 RepID=A8F7D8_PSELT|nr:MULTISPECIES: ScpA family protein [Pseudothermotoga]ABV34072.1 chromosome segregation and condensation protein ScpA [Pseudothermotoga lettingae TMO]MDI3494683.1 segregation and condensation protein [Pseudothermotoga sp.]MDK2884697.1 segregation and condensation protein [Pseudothermotoga sp.]
MQEFEGPLDLLLYLVRRRKINVREISISQLADEFIEHVEQMKKLDLNITSDFLTTATQLMEIKARYMIPALSEKEVKELKKREEDIYRRLELYEQIKQLSEDLQNRVKSMAGRKAVRLAALPQIEHEKLTLVLQSALQEISIKKAVYKIRKQSMTVEQAMENILENLSKDQEINLYDILKKAEDRYQLIIYFLAILELIFFKKISLFEKENDFILRGNGFEA